MKTIKEQVTERQQQAIGKGYNNTRFFDQIIYEFDKSWKEWPYNGRYSFKVPDTTIEIIRGSFHWTNFSAEERSSSSISILNKSEEVFSYDSHHREPGIGCYVPGNWENVIAKLRKVVTDKEKSKANKEEKDRIQREKDHEAYLKKSYGL